MSQRTSTLAPPRRPETSGPPPTVFGLTPVELHDRFWAAYGVQVVRKGDAAAIERRAELYLLCEPETLVFMELSRVLRVFMWLEPELLRVRIHTTDPASYREVVVADSLDHVVRVQRIYGETVRALSRVAVTTSPEIARRWADSSAGRGAWRRLRQDVPRARRAAIGVGGSTFDAADPRDTMRFLTHLIRVWPRPAATVPSAKRIGRDSWGHAELAIPADARLIGPVWIGAGRTLEPGACVVGPAVLWDAATPDVPAEPVAWSRIGLSPAPRSLPGTGGARSGRDRGRRMFDIVFALVVLAFTLPLYPIIALAILIEDGWPVFFGHRRETLGGREFSCWKFRSMRKDAEAVTAGMQLANQADGPQFFVDPATDPRLTRVGRFIRRWQLDELPQFANVLLGHMSIVGPRPSPRGENQFCPGWREARLSMRPGLTGLWQVRRTRAPGLDFQEWIRFDLLYADSRSWTLDLSIIWMTIQMVMPWAQLRWWKERRATSGDARPEPRSAGGDDV